MSETLLHCACGKVEVAVSGAPILTAACHCDDCRAGGAHLESLPGAWAVRDASGGTYYALFRKDRYRVTKGAELLEPWKLRDTPTSRVYARCCNSGMFVRYDSGPHWVSVYAPGFEGKTPELEMRVNARFAAGPVPDDVPTYQTFPLRFVVKLVLARLAMLFG